MKISADHITGFVVGLGAAAVGFYVYKKNQHKVDDWLRKQGIDVPATNSANPASMTVEDLVAEKERLEDLIAEREHAAKEAAAQPGAEQPAPANN